MEAGSCLPLLHQPPSNADTQSLFDLCLSHLHVLLPFSYPGTPFDGTREIARDIDRNVLVFEGIGTSGLLPFSVPWDAAVADVPSEAPAH